MMRFGKPLVRVVAIYGTLIVVALAVIFYAARSIYFAAREQAIAQAQVRQELIAHQTARGVESHYNSIVSDLLLLMRDDSDPAITQPARTLMDRLNPGRGPLGPGRRLSDIKTIPVTPAMLSIMWRQLSTRVETLFVVESSFGRSTVYFPETPRGREESARLADKHADWLKTITEPVVSPFFQNDAGEGYHLIAVPGVGPAPRGNANQPLTLVAVVPVAMVQKRLFDPLNDQGQTTAVLIDEKGVVMIAIDPRITGVNVFDEVKTTDATATVKRMLSGGRSGSVVADEPTLLRGVTLPPRVIAGEQITTLPGRKWSVLVSQPLAEVDELVGSVFRGAIGWAIFVAAVVTLVLVGTTLQLIQNQRRLERARHDLLRREIEQARQIQLAWLPDEKSQPPGLDIAAANLPANHISGDFYNWFRLHDGRVAVVIGDVTGHGMSAAFLMATTQLLVRTTLQRVDDPGACLEEVNKQLCTQKFRGQFVTMVIVVIDPRNSTLEVASAGHYPPLVEKNGRFESIAVEPELVLGVEPTAKYPTHGFVITPGATVVLFTDGVVEAQNGDGQEYQVAAMLKTISISRKQPRGLIDHLIADVKQWCGAEDIRDDLTLVAAQLRN